jgi:hypothetical protein
LKYLLDPHARSGEDGVPVLTPKRRFDENPKLQQQELLGIMRPRLDEGLGRHERWCSRPNAHADSDTEYWCVYDVRHVNANFAFISSFSICSDAHVHFRIYLRIHDFVHGYDFVDFDSYLSPCGLYPIIGTHTHIAPVHEPMHEPSSTSAQAAHATRNLTPAKQRLLFVRYPPKLRDLAPRLTVAPPPLF